MYDRSKCEILIVEEDFDITGIRGITPVYSTLDAAAADVAVPNDVVIPAHNSVYIDLLLRTNIDYGYCIIMFPRSSILIKKHLIMPVSIIDSDYKGNIHAPVYNPTDIDITLYKGDRIAQIMLHDCSIHVTNNISNCVRNDGCGSTGE